MKKLLLALALFAFITVTNGQDAPRMQAVKLNPLSLFLATGNVSYERKVAENQSFQIGGFYSGVGIGDIKYSGFGFTPEYRVYFAGHKEAMNGVYVAPFLRYQNFKLKDKNTNEKTTLSTFGGGASLGWEKTWNSGLVLDLFAGPSYSGGRFKNDGDKDDFDVSSAISGFGIRAGVAFGFGF